MSASATMPYFVRPSVHLTAADKADAYAQATADIAATLTGETDAILKMATVTCLLKTALPYYYWAGFYLVSGPGRLIVGPYQGTLGCLHIPFGKGVCGKAAQEHATQIVADVHALAQGEEHIACDPHSHSEIVVPVSDAEGRLIAVFDVDSTLAASFDDTDRHWLERIMAEQFAQGPLSWPGQH